LIDHFRVLIDTGSGFGDSNRDLELGLEEIVDEIIKEDNSRGVFNSLVGCLFARNVYTEDNIIEALNAIGIEKTKQSALGILKDHQGAADGRVGVIRHSQRSEKNLAMLLYARKALSLRELENPLLLFLTDPKELKESMADSSFAPGLWPTRDSGSGWEK
jgi:hypothetical protein